MNRDLMNRDLDGIYFRVLRDGKWDNICFSDLTEDEMDLVLERFDDLAMRRMCKLLGKKIREIGDLVDLYGEEE
jgi:hypothetical protein